MTTDDDAESPTLAERVRVALPVVSMACLFASALGVAAVAGAVATGVGVETFDRPEGLTAAVDADGDDTAVVIEHPNGTLPSPERVFVVDDDGARVPWNDTRVGPGVARVTGRGTALGCPRRGATYRVVFEGRTGEETLLSHEVEAAVPASAVQRCEATE